MSISEAAIVLGTSTHSIRSQARAGKLEQREENGLLYVRVLGRHGDARPASRSPATTDPGTSQRRAAERARVWRALITASCIVVLGGAAGIAGYRILEARHERTVARMLDRTTRVNRDLAAQLEAQRVESIALTRQLHEERGNVRRSAENVAQLSSQVDAASQRLAGLETELADEAARREALVAQRVDLIEERDQLTGELAEMMKHLAVARKQLQESQHELARARSRIATLEPHPQASPLPREMLEDLGHVGPSSSPTTQRPEPRPESPTGPQPASERFARPPTRSWSAVPGPDISDQPRLITIVPDGSTTSATE